MSKNKEVRRCFGAWEYVGNQVLEALKGDEDYSSWEPTNPNFRQLATPIAAVVTVAICDKALAVSIGNDECRELARVYADFYAVKPELTLRLLDAIRKRWNDDSTTARIQKHILTSAANYTPVWIKGKTVVVKGIEITKPGKTVTPKDDEIRARLFPNQKPEAREAVTKSARQDIKSPPFRLTHNSPELMRALYALRDTGLDVGLG